MSFLSQLYRPSLALLTDLYQVTMAYGFWKTGMQDHAGVFNLYFRKNPFGGGFTVCCGLEQVLDYLSHFRFEQEDLSYLSGLTGNDGKPLFEPGFLEYLGALKLSCEVDAIPEGTAVFPLEPLLRVRGPIIQTQLLETPLLNLVNFATLIATKAARICSVAGQDPVVEFGLRRAQGVDGSISAARAAYVGGCAGTSSLLAGKLLNIPVRGTQAHSWVMFFESEREAFLEYAKALPNNCVLLVDTYDTLRGVRRAAEVGRWLRKRGHRMTGIRLDSGDLAYLSIEARRMLDEAGLPDAAILASNELDEHVISSLKQQGARISGWGVGTRLVTGFDEPALGGVYKLAAVRRPGGEWRHKLKLSEQAAKTSTPGMLQVRRFTAGEEFVADLIYDELLGSGEGRVLVDPMDSTRRKTIPPTTVFEDLLVPVFRRGRTVYESPSLEEIRSRTGEQLSRIHGGIKRFVNPHGYPVGLEPALLDLKTRLILEARRER